MALAKVGSAQHLPTSFALGSLDRNVIVLCPPPVGSPVMTVHVPLLGFSVPAWWIGFADDLGKVFFGLHVSG